MLDALNYVPRARPGADEIYCRVELEYICPNLWTASEYSRKESENSAGREQLLYSKEERMIKFGVLFSFEKNRFICRRFSL